ncbi:MAG: 5-(carboxyamino)imidazole ribonucleotide mutase [Deltaproteobacteria bacterium]|nr:5-(carboxyamino)imidazole ribonucleotide mutase [Deltaproteobacteria bacterium]
MIQKKTKHKKLVSIVMGSETDLSVMSQAGEALTKFEIPFEISIVSAHRTPEDVASFAEGARKRGIRVIIAGAGGAAHLPGMVAASTELPVIGVPVPVGVMQGQDALWSIVQMPKGVPVATVAIGNAWNAGVLAAQILGSATDKESQKILNRLAQYKKEMKEMVRKSRKKL